MSYLLQFDVAEDLAMPGCPICRGCERAAWDSVHCLLRDDVNDPRVRLALAGRGGLCGRHVLLAVTVAQSEDDSLGLALLNDLLVVIARERIKAAATALPRRHRGKRAKPMPLVRCMVCDAEDRRADAYLDLIATAALRSQLRRAAIDPEHGLCMPHAARGLDRSTTPAQMSAIADAALARADHLQRNLADLIRKQSHEHRSEPPGTESRAGHEAAAWLAGTA